ncbi:MAG: phenylalanine--tRNA ligase subunit beta, partial [Elusimicrobia bacterium]|nr:phenylalanine--tRNA ligase subunit beta [Elusimicrobiota bacterium]
MRILYSWLKDFIDLQCPPDELAQKFLPIGIEVESMEKLGAQFSGVYAAKILKIDKHPNADKLSLVEVYDGQKQFTVVCGAKNIAVGQNVPLAHVGAKLPDGELKKAKIRGIESEGMICSSQELRILGGAADGILVLGEDTTPGADVSKLFGEPDCVFDLKIAPNRPDLLSHLGVARELSALLNLPLKKPQFNNVESSGKSISVAVQAQGLCPRYVGRVIKNISNAPSPDWLKKRLLAMGTKPRGAAVDITNYVLYETGCPLHAFDLDKLAGPQICVRTAKIGEKFTTLEGQEITLDSQCLVIADKDKPAALAAIIGGQDSGVTENTKNIFLESAYFAPSGIYKTARRLRLRTEASIRFAGGADISAAVFACERACALFKEFCGGSFSEIVDIYPSAHKPAQIAVDGKSVNKILGTDIPAEKIAKALNAVGKLDSSSEKWTFTPPSHRHDLESKWDLAEEAARFCGYNLIPDTAKPAMLYV